MRWYPAAKFSIAAHVEGEQPAGRAQMDEAERLTGKRDGEGGEELGDVHGGQTDEHTAGGSSTAWWRNTRTGMCLSGARRRSERRER